MSEENEVMQLSYTVKNTKTGKEAKLVIVDDLEEGMSQKELEKIVERAVRMSRKGSNATLVVTHMEFGPKPIKKSSKSGHSHKDTPNKDRVKSQPVLLISVGQALRYRSETIADKLTNHLAEDPENQDRIDEVLFLLRLALMVRTSNKRKVRKELNFGDFKELLLTIYEREVWSEAMIAAFWELRLFFSKRNREQLKQKLHQEAERINEEKGTAYFTQQGAYVEVAASEDGFSFGHCIHLMVEEALAHMKKKWVLNFA